jgi:cell division protein FtsL
MNPLAALFDQRFRGFRVVELVAGALVVLMVFWVYSTKTSANEERTQIAKIERSIAAEQRRLRLLRAEAAHLEQPGRIETLSEAYLGMEPVPAKREARPESLVEIARTGAEGAG